MARINPTVERQLGKKDFLYQAEMIDTELSTGVAECGVLDVSRVQDVTIQFTGLSTNTIRGVKLYGTTDRAVGATLQKINLSTSSVDVKGATVRNCAEISVTSGAITVTSAPVTQPILHIPAGLAQIQLVVDGTTTVGVKATAFAKSY